MKWKILIKFTIMFVFLQLLFLTRLSCLEYFDVQRQFSNYQLTDNAKTLILTDEFKPAISDLKEILDPYKNVSMIFNVYESSDLEVYAFTGEEFLLRLSNNYDVDSQYAADEIAVVGQNIINSNYCYTDNNNDIIFKFDNMKYCVIDVIPSDISSMLNNTAFINIELIDYTKPFKIIIDGTNNKEIENVVDCIKEKYQAYDVELNNNYIRRSVISREDVSFANILFSFFILSLLVMTITITYVHYYKEIKIKSIVGFNYTKIFFSIEKNIFFFVIISTCIVTLIYLMLYTTSLVNNAFADNLIFLFIFTIIIYLVLSALLYVYCYIIEKSICKKIK